MFYYTQKSIKRSCVFFFEKFNNKVVPSDYTKKDCFFCVICGGTYYIIKLKLIETVARLSYKIGPRYFISKSQIGVFKLLILFFER